MKIEGYALTRFQHRRDRVIGDSQVHIAHGHYFALELKTDTGETGLGFGLSLFHPLPALAEIERVFEEEAWPGLLGQPPAGLVHRVSRPRGGNARRTSLAFEEAINQACWDLAAKQAGLPLWRLLGGVEPRVRTYASGLDYHLSDAHYVSLFTQAAAQGHRGFKIKVGHPDVEWDLHRLRLLRDAVGDAGPVMVDSNEAWSPKEAIRRLRIYRKAGFDILWVEDPCLRDDFDGLREIREGAPWVHVNSGEYLDLRGKRKLLEARGSDILNVHGHVSDVMRAGWLAAEHGVPVSLGNTILEIGVHMAAALPEADWLEYSFQNYNHLVEEPILLKDGVAIAPDRPGHGLALSEAARREHACPQVMQPHELPPPPASTPVVLAS
ncbi:MAG: mandelate racemase/muconate lactonizing enzyme family protein [Alsobacter sp.]